ncbi:choline/ethanolaminephosphotransferase, putative [Entamoeba invadens IP1]|uniref:Choline/ethanolaminephosphotransferase, putative n=1 Tax=Entamoeba invadens TaxID=33085 RepID=S0B0J3_ENTIV|nr:choline/ethanolaminephosphotransferase, putative [Entamoeba invadens IP1]ELP90731.1 choline/ethanolaminephosphotransferase, putative [Entamoeba invadens IP1]BAN40684.1 choline/ethanolaminephosphotransferase, putative [Entamoeba invadens]|eukprot:XP_004257502.1 choline/ethanolaminephosphotransferase, putative [Entamoeba invadens IP1]
MFIKKSSLENLSLYKYSGVDLSLCANYILSPYFWEPLLKYVIPPTIAPNVITLIGGIFMFLAHFLFFFDSPTGQEDVSTFTVVMSGLLMFLYQTADNLDGKQARRTKNGSPLGELFDHGVDTFMMGIFALIIVTIFKFETRIQLILLIQLLAVFYMSHWEEYHTNTLILGYVFNPTELQLLTIFGLDIYVLYPQIINVSIFSITVKSYAMVCIILFCFIAVVFYVQSTVSHIHSTNQCSFISALYNGTPYAIFYVCACINVLLFPKHFLVEHFHLIVLLLIFLNAYVTQRLIVHRILKEPVQQYHTLLFLFVVFTINTILYALGLPSVIFNFSTFTMLLFAIAIDSTLIIEVIISFSTFLGIHVFRINVKE